MHRPIILSLVFGVTLLHSARAAAPEATVLVGILEDAPAATSARPKPHVRVVFRYSAAGGWEAFPNDCLSPECLTHISTTYPPLTTWTVSLAGLTVGTVTGRTPAAFRSVQEIGLQDITSRGPMPFVGKPSIEYAGAVGQPVRRPLLATSSARKPQRSQAGWTAGSPDAEDLDRVWPAFRRLVPLIDNCPPAAEPASDSAADPNAPVTPAADADLPPGRKPKKLDLEIPSAWIARSGDALLRVVVRQDVYEECDGPRVFPSQLWMLREASGRVRALPGQLADDRADLVGPLEFTDLLRDGHEEVLFQAAGHDRGGYVLYYERFQKRVAYLWAFH